MYLKSLFYPASFGTEAPISSFLKNIRFVSCPFKS